MCELDDLAIHDRSYKGEKFLGPILNHYSIAEASIMGFDMKSFQVYTCTETGNSDRMHTYVMGASSVMVLIRASFSTTGVYCQ